MKKYYLKSMVLLIAFVLMSVIPCKTQAKTKYVAELGIYAYGDKGVTAASGNHGHTWLTIKNISNKDISFCKYVIKSGDRISLGASGDEKHPYGGVYINLEDVNDEFFEGKVWSYTTKITEQKLEKLAKMTPKESYYHDGLSSDGDIRDNLFHNCTTFALKLWNKAVGNDKSRKLSEAFIDIPGDTAKKIASWTGAKHIYYKAPYKKYMADVFYIRDDGKLVPLDKFKAVKDKVFKIGINQKFKPDTSLKKTEDKLSKKIILKTNSSKIRTKNGVIYGKKYGTAKVQVTVKGRPNIKASFTVKVCKPKIKMQSKSIKLAVGEKAKLEAILSYSDASIKWRSSNESIATVKKGVVKGKKKGKATITAYAKTSAGIKKVSCTVTVSKEETPYKLYKELLEKGTFYYGNYYDMVTIQSFCLLDIDHDNVKELVVASKAGIVSAFKNNLTAIGVYTISGDKLVRLGAYENKSGSSIFYYRDKKMLVSTFVKNDNVSDTELTNLYSILMANGQKIIYPTRRLQGYIGQERSYYGEYDLLHSNEYSISWGEYVNTMKQIYNDIEEVTLYTNNSANRSLFVK